MHMLIIACCALSRDVPTFTRIATCMSMQVSALPKISLLVIADTHSSKHVKYIPNRPCRLFHDLSGPSMLRLIAPCRHMSFHVLIAGSFFWDNIDKNRTTVRRTYGRTFRPTSEKSTNLCPSYVQTFLIVRVHVRRSEASCRNMKSYVNALYEQRHQTLITDKIQANARCDI